MNTDELIQLTKTLYGEEDVSDKLASSYLKLAQMRIMQKRNPFEKEIDVDELWEHQYDSLACEIAVFMLSKRGAEGEVAHKENGIDRIWSNKAIDIPTPLLKRVIPKAKAIGE